METHKGCPGCQVWDTYDAVFIDFSLKLNQYQLLSALLDIVFDDYPNNLPEHILSPILAKWHRNMHDELERRNITSSPSILEAEQDQFFKQYEHVEMNDKLQKLDNIFHNVYVISRYFAQLPELTFPSFMPILLSQEIVSSCNLMEGFISNSLKLAIRHNSNILEHDKKIWNQFKKYGGSTLSDQLIDDFIFRFLKGNVLDKVNTLNNALKLAIRQTVSMKKGIEELIIIRNSIVHNGGKINQRYKRFLNNSKAKIGEPIILKTSKAEFFIDQLVDLSYEIYKEFSLKLLGKDKTSLTPKPQEV